MPDVLTWHVSNIGANASLLAQHHAQLAAWAESNNIPLPPIGHNEIVGPRSVVQQVCWLPALFITHFFFVPPSETISPASNLYFLSVLDQLRVCLKLFPPSLLAPVLTMKMAPKVDHTCRACWEKAGVSPCWDASLDALLTQDGMLQPRSGVCEISKFFF